MKDNNDEKVNGLLEQLKNKDNEISELNNKIKEKETVGNDDSNKKIEELEKENLTLKKKNDEMAKKLAEYENKNKDKYKDKDNNKDNHVEEKTFDKIAPSAIKNKILLGWGSVKTLSGSASLVFLLICQPIPGLGLAVALIGAGVWTASGVKDFALSVFSLLSNAKNKKELVKTELKTKDQKEKS